MCRLTFRAGVYTAMLYRFAVALVLLWLTRFAFAAYNADVVGSPSLGELLWLSLHGVRFDLTAAAYFNALFIAMNILPFGFVYNRIYRRVSDWVYWICNSLMLAINIGDIPYYRFTGARLRWTNVLNITTDSSIGSIVGQYAADYWWAFAAGAAVIALLVWASLRVRVTAPVPPVRLRAAVGLFVLFGGLTFLAMRGRVGSGIPLAIPDAAFVVRKAPHINVVLNSPFCILRSLNRKKSNIEPEIELMPADTLAAIRSSYHPGAPAGSVRRHNIVNIIIESGGAEWVDALSVTGTRRGLMPFLDSIAGHSLVFAHTIACSRSSCGGATAVMTGFPAFDPFYFMLSPYNKNTLDSPARLLAAKGWDTTFYYGCKHGSFNIDQTAYASGYHRIIDREAYGDDRDFDGMWGIFDYPMAAFVARDLGSLRQPFIATWFTVSAHGPFTVPDDWDTSVFIHPEASPERGLEYTDMALRRFFSLAATQPWYDNTIFVITADHGNRDFKGTPFDGDYVRNHIPFVIYAPGGGVEQGVVSDRVVSQHDIAATTLSLIGYDSPYVSVGADALSDSYRGYGIARTDGGRYIVIGTRYTIYTTPDLGAVDEVYDTHADIFMSVPLEGDVPSETLDMLRFAQAFVQDYTARLNHDRLSVVSE